MGRTGSNTEILNLSGSVGAPNSSILIVLTNAFAWLMHVTKGEEDGECASTGSPD